MSKKSKGRFNDIWSRLRRNRLAMLGLIFLGIIILSAVFANFIADYDSVAIKQNYLLRLQPPSLKHWFGTDAYGRDVFARVIHGARVSLAIGVFSVGIATLLGVIIGSAVGYYGGLISEAVMRVVDIIMSIPSIILALAFVAALGGGVRNLIIAMSVSLTTGFVRITRASVMSITSQEFIEAGKVCGTPNYNIILKHVLPNAIGPVIVQATVNVALAIIAAAGLSFIGMGVSPPQPEWGMLLAEGKEFMLTAPYLVIFPGIAIVITALSINLLGDGLRDALDPRLKD